MIKRFLLFSTAFLLGGFVGYSIFKFQNTPFETLTAEEMHQKIIKQRDYAIKKVVEAGVFRCCINPPCTMCYLEANQWNNNQAGTCACDDLIARGKEPCPQCIRGLCSEGACEVGNN